MLRNRSGIYTRSLLVMGSEGTLVGDASTRLTTYARPTWSTVMKRATEGRASQSGPRAEPYLGREAILDLL